MLRLAKRKRRAFHGRALVGSDRRGPQPVYFLKKHLLNSLSTNYVLGLDLHAGRGRVTDRHIDGIHQRVRELAEVYARH